MQSLSDHLNLSPELFEKFVLSLAIFFFLSLCRFLCVFIIRRRITDAMSVYSWRRAILYTYTLLLILLIGPIWTRGIASLTTFLGLASAGVAIAMHDTIANMAGWFSSFLASPLRSGIESKSETSRVM